MIKWIGNPREFRVSGNEGSISRIIGGVDSGEYEFPHQVSIQLMSAMGGKTHICSGTIYNESIIITSALCLEGRETNLRILAGLHNYLGNDQLGQASYGTRVVKHPKFNK